MPQHNGFTQADVPNQSGKCFIVTGANSGIGFQASRVLAARGARVLLACRDEAKADSAMAEITKESVRADLAFLPLDLADLDSVRVAAQLVAKEPRVDILVNNAGVSGMPLTRTKQGFELQFGINHLGSFALTSLLLGKLAQTSGSRVVVTSSKTHEFGKIDLDDLNAHKGYSARGRYAASKLANALFLFELDRRLRAIGSSIIAVGCHPGGTLGTNINQHEGVGGKIAIRLLAPFFNSAEMGAWPMLQAATGQVTPGGYYGPTGLFGMRGPSGDSPRSEKAHDTVVSEWLWDASIALTGIDPGLSPVGVPLTKRSAIAAQHR